ncbi:hypothetical protein [Streptomyces tendae]
MTVAFAVAVALDLALLVAFWRLARTENVDVALTYGGTAFVAALTVIFMVMTYMRGE